VTPAGFGRTLTATHVFVRVSSAVIKLAASPRHAPPCVPPAWAGLVASQLIKRVRDAGSYPNSCSQRMRTTGIAQLHARLTRRGAAHQDNINRFRGRTSAAFGFAVTRFIVMRIRQGTFESRGKRCSRRGSRAWSTRHAVPLRKRPSPPRHREAAAPSVYSRGAGLAKVETRSVPSANLLKSLAGATGLEPATSGVTGRQID
jgi:hypothetical protein